MWLFFTILDFSFFPTRCSSKIRLQALAPAPAPLSPPLRLRLRLVLFSTRLYKKSASSSSSSPTINTDLLFFSEDSPPQFRISLRACYGGLRFVMENGNKGYKVIVSGKLRAQRAKSMKFKDGYMISSGQPMNEYIDSAVRHVLLRHVG